MVLAAAAGGALFQIAFEVSELDDELAQLNRDIRAHRDTIHVLRAEWSFLNQPDRLEELTRRHLDLLPVSGAQIAGGGAVPVALREELPVARSNIAGAIIPAVIAAPKAKPAVPMARANSSNQANLDRSINDVLRKILATPASAAAGASR
ncbi:MAG TPA: hypothetical protein DIT35_05500 [Rhodospirillaceae bacterium]|nr:hypothetical protein [Rhodospirillaceae bacterium]